jgi:LysM repeat protein
MTNAVATANTIASASSYEQSTVSPNGVGSAGAVSLAADRSTDTSFLDFGTSPPATTSRSILTSASHSSTSSPADITSVAPVTTGSSSTNNGGNSEPPVNMPPGQGGNGELNNAAPKSSNMPHAGQGSQDGNNGRPVSGENGDQKQNKSAHRGPSAADQQSPGPLSHDNAGNQGSKASQLQPPQPANSNIGGSRGSPAAQRQPTQPASPNKGGDQSRPATRPTHDGLTFAPILSYPFNFYDGTMFDPASNSMTSGSDRMAQAREINANLPASIQNALNDNSINYYFPGIGDFYYSKVCSDAGCSIIQVALSCNCYVDGTDQQIHYLTVNQGAELKISIFKNETRLPPATKYSVKPGDTLFDIAVRYGAELSLILAANPAISNPDLIFPSEVIRIPAQAYIVVEGDYLHKMAKAYDVSTSVLEALNDQIDNPDLIFQGQIIKVPARKFGAPFCTTVEPGDSLFSISDNLGVTLSSVEAVNPQIKDKNLIFPKQIVNVSVYLPAQGNLTSNNYCPVCEMNNKTAPKLTGAKFAIAMAAPKVVVTTIEVGPTTAPIIAKAPYQRSNLNNSLVEKGKSNHQPLSVIC